jgi:hypothetical protein
MTHAPFQGLFHGPIISFAIPTSTISMDWQFMHDDFVKKSSLRLWMDILSFYHE